MQAGRNVQSAECGKGAYGRGTSRARTFAMRCVVMDRNFGERMDGAIERMDGAGERSPCGSLPMDRNRDCV